MNETSPAQGPVSASGFNTSQDHNLSQTLSDRDEVFDPFGLGEAASKSKDDDASSTDSPKPPPQLQRLKLTKPKKTSPRKTSPTSSSRKSSQIYSDPKRISSPLPPRIAVKLGIHEEVSSLAKTDADQEGASVASIEGTIYAQVQSSDAMKNIPFILTGRNALGNAVQFQGNPEFCIPPAFPSPGTLHNVVNVPKKVSSVTLGHYAVTEEVQHMPLLVERKISIHGKRCLVAVQVRSKLTNQGDLEDFTIALAVPERVNGSTVKVVHGDGVWDELKRTIKWKFAKLKRGESFMITAQAELWATGGSAVVFPVLLRCSSAYDQVSSVEFRVLEAEGHRATITFSTLHSCRLLHRLP